LKHACLQVLADSLSPDGEITITGQKERGMGNEKKVTKNQKRKKRTLCFHVHIIVAGMIHPASVFTAAMLAAVMRGK